MNGIEFRDVAFGYRPGQPVIRNLSFRVAPRQVVALVGPTGSGKTSVAALIHRFYDVWEGEVLVIESVGFNDRGQLDALGHRHSSALRVTERYRRRDAGHMDVELTFEDPQTFTTPISVRFGAGLRPDTDLIDYFCAENEKDRQRIVAAPSSPAI